MPFIDRIRRRLETVIYGTDRERPLSAASGLYLLSLGYRGAVRLRAFGYRKKLLKTNRLPCAVISIGNITVGGTGKTPVAVYTARRVKDFGYTVVVMSRGYRGAAENTGGIVSDGRSLKMAAGRAGDEPYMMALQLPGIPVMVGKNRFVQGMRAIDRFHPEVIVLDDGFQHLSLNRDIDLVLLDSRHPVGNGHLLPRGPLREPVTALQRADAFIFTRWKSDGDGINENTPAGGVAETISISGKPVFKSVHIPGMRRIVRKGSDGKPPAYIREDRTEDTAQLSGRRVFAFSGIADNDDFRSTVAGIGCRITGFKPFPDHHVYTAKDLNVIRESAVASGAECIVTTEKDDVRIPASMSWPVDLAVLGVTVSLKADGDGESAFDAFLAQRLKVIIGASNS